MTIPSPLTGSSSFRRTSWLALLTALLLASPALAQNNSPIFWTVEGPNNFGGRTRTLMFDDGGATLFAGSPGGGLWVTTSQGQDWRPVAAFNEASSANPNPSMVVSSIAKEGNTIIVGTGELASNFNLLNSEQLLDPKGFNTNAQNGYLGHSGFPGKGVYVSTDGGASFDNDNATWGRSFSNVDYAFENPWISVQDVAIRNGRALAATLHGVFYSDDNFQTVTQAVDTFQTEAAHQIDTSGTANRFPTNTAFDIEFGANQRVYAATANGVFISDDNGATFDQRLFLEDFPRDTTTPGSGAPISTARYEVAVSPSNPDVVYVAEVGQAQLKLTGIWRSSDAGQNWTQIAPTSNNSFRPLTITFPPVPFGQIPSVGIGDYSLVLKVDPDDPMRLFFGGFRLFEYTPQDGWSDNGTRPLSTQPADPKFVPANLHDLTFQPGNANTFFLGSDHEIARTTDGGNFFGNRHLSYNTSFCYDVAAGLDNQVFTSVSSYGLLRRSSKNTTSYTRTNGTISGNPIEGLVESSIIDPSQLIIGGRTGDVARSFDRGNAFESIIGFPDTTDLNFPDGTPDPCGPNTDTLPNADLLPAPVITPFVLDEVITSPDNVIIDSSGNEVNPRYVFMANKAGVYLTRNPFGQVGPQNDSTFTTTRISPCFESLQEGPTQVFPTAMAVSGDTTHTLYVGTNTGRVFRIPNANDPDTSLPQWGFQEIISGDESWYNGSYVSSISVDPRHPDTVVVTYAGYEAEQLVVPPPPQLPTVTTHIVAAFDAASAADPTFNIQSVSGDSALPYAPIYDAIFNPVPDSTREWLLMIGTENGIFTTNSLKEDTTGTSIPTTWVESNAGGMSRVPTFRFDARRFRRKEVTFENGAKGFAVEELFKADIFAATHGRGLMRVSEPTGRSEDEQSFDRRSPNRLHIFPNPTDNLAALDFQLEQSRGSANIRVFDVNGREVLRQDAQLSPSKDVIRLNVAELPNGLYVVKADVQTGNGSEVKTGKLLIQR